MQYHKAAHLGQQRSKDAQMKLFKYTGFAMLTYTIKQSQQGFDPVGEEMLVAKMQKEDQLMLFICDNDGYVKAQSKPMPVKEGNEIFSKILSDGLPEFDGIIKTVS